MSAKLPTVTLAAHPHAAASIRRLKAWGGIGGFVLGALASWAHGGLMAGALERGLAGGVVGYLVAWFAAVSVWRHLVRAQARAAIEKRRRAVSP